MYPVLPADPEAAAAGEGRLGPLRGGLCPALSGWSVAPGGPRSSTNLSVPSFPQVPRKRREITSWHRGAPGDANM